MPSARVSNFAFDLFCFPDQIPAGWPFRQLSVCLSIIFVCKVLLVNSVYTYIAVIVLSSSLKLINATSYFHRCKYGYFLFDVLMLTPYIQMRLYRLSSGSFWEHRWIAEVVVSRKCLIGLRMHCWRFQVMSKNCERNSRKVWREILPLWCSAHMLILFPRGKW